MAEMTPADVPDELVEACGAALLHAPWLNNGGGEQIRAMLAAVLPLHRTPPMQFRICQSPHGVLQDWTDITDGYCEFFGDMTSAGRVRIQFRHAPDVRG